MISLRDRGGDCKARGGTVIWLRFASALPDRMAMPDIADLCRYRRRGGLLELAITNSIKPNTHKAHRRKAGCGAGERYG